MTSVVFKGQASDVFTTKKELYEFLVVEIEYFLPTRDISSLNFLRDIAQGKKKVSRPRM